MINEFDVLLVRLGNGVIGNECQWSDVLPKQIEKISDCSESDIHSLCSVTRRPLMPTSGQANLMIVEAGQMLFVDFGNCRDVHKCPKRLS